MPKGLVTHTPEGLQPVLYPQHKRTPQGLGHLGEPEGSSTTEH